MTHLTNPPARTDEPPLMGCGHAANATVQGQPCCVICIGIVAGATEPVEKPDLTGRVARCSSCQNTADSKWTLAFFRHEPQREHDSFYCGCRGWD